MGMAMGGWWVCWSPNIYITQPTRRLLFFHQRLAVLFVAYLSSIPILQKLVLNKAFHGLRSNHQIFYKPCFCYFSLQSLPVAKTSSINKKMCYQYIRGYQIYQNNKLHNNSFRLHYVNTHFLTMKICKLYLFYHLSGTVVFINFKHLIVLCQQLFDKHSY